MEGTSMKMVKKITATLIVVVVCMMMFDFMTCQVWADNFNLNAFDTEPTQSAGMK